MGGPTPADLATVLVDQQSDYSLDLSSVTTQINAAGTPASNPRAMGLFFNGTTQPGTLLPPINQNGAGDAVYAGGIGIPSGVCLCTGLITDNDSQVSGIPAGLGVGVEGPNNGSPLSNEGTDGEIDSELGTPSDTDFTNVVNGGSDPGDATVLLFKITLNKPGYLRTSFVHGSDEYPRFELSQFNDTPLVLVGDANGNNFVNFITFIGTSGTAETLSLNALSDCGLLEENLVAPNPPSLPDKPTGHANVQTDLHFDHEFGGFTKKLTRETEDVLSSATYTIKVVVQDVDDDNLDSGTFFEANGLKLYSFHNGDLNLDGKVDIIDFGIFAENYDEPGIYKYVDGDMDGNGTVDIIDFGEFSAAYNEGATGGNVDFCADFNRDGTITMEDSNILAANLNQLNQCASRFEGDADGDGDVDSDDQTILIEESNTGVPCPGCTAGGGSQQASSGGGGAGASQSAGQPSAARSAQQPAGVIRSLDFNQDGRYDAADIEIWRSGLVGQ